jgi:hypothetical protein
MPLFIFDVVLPNGCMDAALPWLRVPGMGRIKHANRWAGLITAQIQP